VVELGWAAGKLWHYLNNNGPTQLDNLLDNYREIVTPELIKLMAPETKAQTSIYMAIGWLLREKKVKLLIDPKTKKNVVDLIC